MLRKRKLIEGRLPHIFIAKDIAQVTDSHGISPCETHNLEVSGSTPGWSTKRTLIARDDAVGVLFCFVVQ